MINIKTKEEIELIRESNHLVSRTLAELARNISAGITTLELDRIAEEFIRDHGAIPGFLGYKGYPKTLCTSVNQEVVHGIPSAYALKEGDIISIDCGVLYNGYYGDSAYTFAIGEISDELRNLLKTTKEALLMAVGQVRAGKRTGDISHTVQSHCENNGFSVVRELVGHGIGKGLHEAPEIPNYGRRGQGPRLQEGMVLCIEPMINMGRKEIAHSTDGWTVYAADKMPSAHFELCVAVGRENADVLSPFAFIEEIVGDIV